MFKSKVMTEAIDAVVYVSSGSDGQWYLTIDNFKTGHPCDLPITDTQKETLVNEGVPIL